MRCLGLILLAVLTWTTLSGCGKAPPAKTLPADEEQKLQQQLQKARQAEGGAQKNVQKNAPKK